MKGNLSSNLGVATYKNIYLGCGGLLLHPHSLPFPFLIFHTFRIFLFNISIIWERFSLSLPFFFHFTIHKFRFFSSKCCLTSPSIFFAFFSFSFYTFFFFFIQHLLDILCGVVLLLHGWNSVHIIFFSRHHQ